MTTVTEADIKELKELIVKQSEQLNSIDKRLAVIEARLDEWKPMIQKIPDLAEKVGELKNWKQFFILGVTSLVSGLIGWLIRGGNRI